MFNLFHRKQKENGKEVELNQQTEIVTKQKESKRLTKITKFGDIETLSFRKSLTYLKQVPLRDVRCLDPLVAHYFPKGFIVKDNYIILNLVYITALLTDNGSYFLQANQDITQNNVQNLSTKLKNSLDRIKGNNQEETLQLQYVTLIGYCLQQVTQSLGSYISELEQSTKDILGDMKLRTTAYNLEILRRIKIYTGNLQDVAEDLQESFLETLNKINGDPAPISHMCRFVFRGLAKKNQPRYQKLSSQFQALFQQHYIEIASQSQKIQTLMDYQEYADEIVSLELDNHRNIILQLEVLTTLWTTLVFLIMVVAGVFNQNLNSNVMEVNHIFYKIVGISVSIVICLFVGAITFLKYNGFLTFRFRIKRQRHEKLQSLEADFFNIGLSNGANNGLSK